MGNHNYCLLNTYYALGMASSHPHDPEARFYPHSGSIRWLLLIAPLHR